AIKRPYFHANTMRAFGDNIYHRDPKTCAWQQALSFHSLPDGRPNPLNVKTDTGSDRVLIGHEFVYWGGDGPQIPDRFRNYKGVDICAGRSYKTNFPEGLAEEFMAWAH